VRAVRIHEHGGPDVLHLDKVPEPVPGAGDLLVRQRATSVNHRDIWIRKGHPHPAYRVDLPAILGIDVCGDVVAVGGDVDGFRVGERITANPYIPCGRCDECRRARPQYCPFFHVYNGAYAEYVVVPAALALAVAPGVPDEHVACFPNAYITAWQMLVGKAGVGPGDTVFVWAGTSGLGSAAIEIAHHAGATVVASAGSEAKLEMLAARDVALVVDHHDAGMVEEVMAFTRGKGATIVFEHVGRATWQRSLELCASGGTIVSAGATSGDEVTMDVTYMFVKQIRILGSRLGTTEDATAALRHLNAGRFRPLVGALLPLEQIADGHRMLEEGQSIGKVVISFGAT
jgi:NADPH:quinone reductase-like Zn-dependent oxidoreductase